LDIARAPEVALISPYPRVGERHGGWTGVASYTANLAHALADSGGSITVVAPSEPGEPAEADDGPVRVERPFERGAGAVPAAIRAALRTDPDVVHLQHEAFLYGGPASVPGLVTGLTTLRRSGTPGVVTMHHVVDSRTVDRSFTRMHRVAAPPAVARAGLSAIGGAIGRLADRVIVHEPAFTDTVRNSTVIPHGVASPATPPREQTRARLGLDRFTVLCFGFVAPYKGLEAALDAARVAGRGVELVVAGGEHPRLRAGRDQYLSHLRDSNPHARFTGFVPDDQVADWFAAADLALFLYPQPVSASGGVALALAHGTPFLMSPEMGATTRAPKALIASRDAGELGSLLHLLATDQAALARVRDAAYALSGDRSWPAVARRHLELYEEVTDADGHGRGRPLNPT
jgi:glycosyltransferase involved in cell wall biosynthesis